MSIPPAAEWLWRAAGLFDAGRYSDALHLVDDWLAEAGGELQTSAKYVAFAHALRARTLTHLDRLDDAVAEADLAVRLDATNAAIWQLRGIVMQAAQRYEDAASSYAHALELDATDPAIWHSKAILLLDLKRPAEAIEAWDRALALQPTNAGNYLTYKSEQLSTLERFAEALTAAEAALAAAPTPSETDLNSDTGSITDDDPVNGVSFGHGAGGADPGRSWYVKGMALQGLKRYSEALEAYEQALSRDPYNLTIWERKLHVVVALHRFREAWRAVRMLFWGYWWLNRQRRYERRLP